MRAALLSLSLVGALAASAAAQVVVGGPPATPPVPRMQGTPRAHAIAGIPDPAWEQKVRQLADSIQIVAGELAAARLANENGDKIGALEQTLGELRGRLGGLEGQLGAMQGQLGAMQGRLAAAQARAEVRAEGRGERVVVMQQQRHPLSKGAIASLIKRMNGDPQGARLPPADSILPADFAVAAGSALGRVAALGDLDVFGTVNGDAVALNGDVVVHKGGRITGDAVSVGGTVRLDGGTVEGEMRSLDKAIVPSAVPVGSNGSSGFLGMLGELQSVMGWLVAMVLLGFASMVFAEDRLRVVASTIESRFGRSLFFGVLAEVSFIPGIILAAVLLAVTIIGIVLLPVAIPGIVVLAALLTVLGFLAVSRVAGQALTRRASSVSVRGAELRSMLAGLFFFFGLWGAAALLGWVPILGSLLHALAFVVTWAAATVGLGAAIISRGGAGARAPVVAAPADTPDIGWQTPTPISGIAAARRPASTSPEL